MNRTNKYWKKMQEGFTLIEILIVVIIIGILAAIAVPTYLNYVKRGYASDAKVAISAIVNASEVYFNEQGEISTLEFFEECFSKNNDHHEDIQ